eukprot:529276_1
MEPRIMRRKHKKKQQNKRKINKKKKQNNGKHDEPNHDLDNDSTDQYYKPHKYYKPRQFSPIKIKRKASKSLSSHFNSHSLNDNNPRNDAKILHKTRKSPPPAPSIHSNAQSNSDEFFVKSSKQINVSQHSTCITPRNTSKST